MSFTIQEMLQGKLSDEDICSSIISLRDKGETAEDIYNYVKCINNNSISVSPIGELMDVCGTGGSSLNRFNVSTSSTFILSALGIKVIKHGNRGSQRPNGSFDLLEKLGINIEQSPNQIEDTIKSLNLGFVFAKHYHPSLKAVAKGRQLAGGRSIFNLAGPLSNPANITYQVIGTADHSKAKVLSEVCLKLGRKKSIVVYGEPGIDEVSISGKTHIYECSNGNVKKYYLTPQDFGITPIDYSNIPGGDAEINKEIFLELINGKGSQAITDMVTLNAGIALYAADKAVSIKEGYISAKECISSGLMKRQFEKYVLTASNKNIV